MWHHEKVVWRCWEGERGEVKNSQKNVWIASNGRKWIGDVTNSQKNVSIVSTQYRRLVGSLKYFCHTMLDLAYNVGMVSRFM